eukprot:GILI01005047.1.p1 GENE.GILI01005047.1~~GILI01005047.1.p1  ORF type:complete len:935 (-),score=370.54 GILI01005047.1:122-2896(-)
MSWDEEDWDSKKVEVKVKGQWDDDDEEEDAPDAWDQEESTDKQEGTSPSSSSATSGNQPLRPKKLAKMKLKEEEEKRKKEEDERKRQEEEEERKRAEEEARQNEIKAKKKEEKRLKKEQAKKEGKYMTKAQKEKAARLALAKAQFAAAAGLADDSDEDDEEAPEPAPVEKKKKPVYGKSKKKFVPQNNQESAPAQETAAPVEVEEEESSESEEEVEEASPVSAVSAPASDSTVAVAPEEIPDAWDAGDDVQDSWDQGSKAQEDKTSNSSTASAASKKAQKEAEEKKKAEQRAKILEEKRAREEAMRKKKAEKLAKAAQQDEDDEDEDDDDGNLRSPICCILGHVDTGKTKLLDKIRHTNVQEGEAGGITQQIGATFFPVATIKEQTARLTNVMEINFNIPGLLIIDTPGHESFTNLRSRGSSLCDLAILVVDIKSGLQQQTIESLNLLKSRKTPFVIALNKVDRMYGWQPKPNWPFRESLATQTEGAQLEFADSVKRIIGLFAAQGLNAALYYENDDLRRNVSIIPTSAVTGEGVPDLLGLIVSLSQRMMSSHLLYLSELQCTVLEVKVIEGLGTTIDVVLVNGVLHEGDTIVVCGLNGPIVTTIRALLTPQPCREMRVKGDYVHHKKVKAAMGVKISAQDLDNAIVGSPLMVVGPDDDLEEIKEEVMEAFDSLLGKLDTDGRGVYVQASTLGSLEALLDFLKESKIPVSAIGIGPVHKKDVMKASVMLEHQKEYATILAFDVRITPEAAQLADHLGVKIFQAEVIYHLFDQFTAYMEEQKNVRRRELASKAVFPCVLKIVPTCVFNKRDPIIVGVDIVQGILRIGTPLCVPDRDNLDIGRVTSIEANHKPVEFARKGQSVAIKIEPRSAESHIMIGRHFEVTNSLVSKISRDSIDALKEHFRDDLAKEDWQLIIQLKKVFGII